MRLTIWESFRGVFYSPYYAAFARKAFEAEGLDVELGAVPDLKDVGDAIRQGRAHVAWGGPMRVMVDHDRNPDSDITCFCEVVARDPFFLVGRDPKPDFQLKDLFDIRLATVSEVPTPWMCLQEDMRRAGLDPDALAHETGSTMAENAEALRRGELDAIQVFEPFVETLLAEGAGHIWYAAAERGPTSYTSFYATRAFLEANPDTATKLTRAIFRTQQWIAQAGPEAFAECVAPYFPDLPQTILKGCIRRYYDLGVWSADPILPRDGFKRQAEGLVSGRLIRAPIQYEKCVERRFAEAVVAERGTPA